VGEVTVWADDSWPWLQVFTGDLPDIRRRGLAVEPMTCPPQAFRTGEDVIRLEPGESWSGEWGIEAA
jgi:Galactose mutarotase and related enzymes